MFELAGLSTFLDIFQKALGLIEKRKDQKRQLFNEIVEPVYADLSVVVGDYYRFFRSFRDDLSQTETRNWATVLEQTKKKREEIVLARNKVLGLTKPFLSASEKREGKQDELLYHFAEAIYGFFCSSDQTEGVYGSGLAYTLRGHTHITSIFDHIEMMVRRESEDDVERFHIIDAIDRILRSLEMDWREISGYYGDLRVFCLT